MSVINCCSINNIKPEVVQVVKTEETASVKRLKDFVKRNFQCHKTLTNNTSNNNNKSNNNIKEDTPINEKPLMPTNAYGEIVFSQNGNKRAKYIRVHSNTNVINLRKFMLKHWGMKTPELLISVTGGAETVSLKSGVKNAFRRGLMKAALSTNAWIVTAGTYTGVMKHVGEDVEQFGLTSDADITAIGIAPWGCIRDKSQLISEDCEGKWPAYYKIENSKQKLGTAYLDPNHSHFILVDDGTENVFTTEITLRTQLEKCISELSSPNVLKMNKDCNSMSLCLLVLNGGLGTFQTVTEAIKNKTPIIAIKGSGRMADILANVSEESIKKNPNDFISEEDKILDKDLKVIFKKYDSKFKEWNTKEIKIYAEIEKICRMNELFSVYELKSYNSEDDLDSAILQSLLKDKNSSNNTTNKIMLALIWNRYDLVKSNITDITSDLSADSYTSLMRYAVHNNRVEFVEQFVNNDKFNAAELTNKKQLESLYKTKNLRSIGLQLKKYMGEYYEPPYANSKSSNDPFYDLFIWAVLNHCFELSKLFLKHSNESSISACLFASAVLTKQIIDDDFVQEEIFQNAENYKQLSIDLLQQCYSVNPQKTHDLLCMVKPKWGNTSCMFVAARSENKLFIAEQACQDLITKVWEGEYSCCSDRKLSESDKTSTSAAKGIRICLRKFTSAKAKFTFNVVSYAIFLTLFSYILVVQLSQQFHWTEAVLIVWVIAFAFEELAQCLDAEAKNFPSKFVIYTTSGWNLMNLMTLLLFLIGIILRFIGLNHGDVMAAARIVLSLDLIMYFFGLLHIYSAHRKLGPKIVMIKKMIVQDLFLFIAILAVFVISYAIASQAILYPNTELTWNLLFQLPRRAYWNVYGELFLDDIEGQKDCTNNASLYKDYNNLRCPSESGRYFVPILMGVYMILTNVLLLNLLIAMFSYTFREVEEKTKNHASFQQFNIVLEYAQRPILPTPLTIIPIVWRWIMKCSASEEKSSEFRRIYSKDEISEQTKLIRWENAIITSYFDSAKRKDDSSYITRKDFENFETTLSKNIADIQNQLNKHPGLNGGKKHRAKDKPKPPILCVNCRQEVKPNGKSTRKIKEVCKDQTIANADQTSL